jgi:hypothetical protein
MTIYNKVKSRFINTYAQYISRPIQKSVFYSRWTKPRVLLYTDSRGINVQDCFNYLHYSTKLLYKCNIDAYLCPHKWTTILDFIDLWKKVDTTIYDCVILHLGVVDVSPRPQRSMLDVIYPQKKKIFDDVFGESTIQKYLHTDLNCEYESDHTINMYSLDMAEKNIIPRLQSIPNLIWIGINKVDKAWRGNYWKDRPQNINIIEDYSSLFSSKLPNSIDLLNLWKLEHIQHYTFDNIHPSKYGSDFIYNEIINRLR